MAAFGHKFCIFGQKCLDKKKFLDNFPAAQNLMVKGQLPPLPTGLG